MSSAEGPFGPGLRRRYREEKSRRYFRYHQRLVELEQRCRLDERAEFRNPVGAHEQRGQSEHRANERGQIWGAAWRAITDQDLMLEQQRLCQDGAHATGAQESHEGGQQVDREACLSRREMWSPDRPWPSAQLFRRPDRFRQDGRWSPKLNLHVGREPTQFGLYRLPCALIKFGPIVERLPR